MVTTKTVMAPGPVPMIVISIVAMTKILKKTKTIVRPPQMMAKATTTVM
jgi:hypothetical protein